MDGAGSVRDDARRQGRRRVTPRPAAGPTEPRQPQRRRERNEHRVNLASSVAFASLRASAVFPPVLLGPGGCYLRPWPALEIVDA